MKKIDNFEDFRLLGIEAIKGLCNVIGLRYEYLRGEDSEAKKMTLYNIIQASYREEALFFLNNATVGISYSSVNKDIMLSICESLERYNHRIYTDLRNIADTRGIITAFEQKLAQQDVFLVLVSTDYLKSEHCMYELFYNYVHNRQNIDCIVRHTIPLWIEGTDLGDDAVNELQKSWEKKKSDLEKLFNKLYNVNRQSLSERVTRVGEINYHFTQIVNTLKNISMVIVDPENVQECIPQLLKKIEDITSQWE